MEAALTLDGAEAVASFEDAYIERARGELGDHLALVDAAVLDRRALVHGTALAGWWCRPDADPNLVVMPNPWDDRAAIEHHEAYCWALSDVVLDRLARGLNEHHGVERGRVYWDLLLRSWLLYVLSAALDRRLYCLALSRLRPELPVASGAPLPVPATMVDAIEIVRTDLGNRALGSELARGLGLRPKPLEQCSPRVGQTVLARRSGLGRLLPVVAATANLPVEARAASLRGRRVVVVGSLGLSRRGTIRLCRRVGGLRLAPGSRRTKVEPSSVDDGSMRDRLAAHPGTQRRVGALTAAAWRLLPRTVVEDYPALLERSFGAYGAPCPVVAANYGPHDAENEFLARCAEAGWPVAFSQHGGMYLQARVNSQERLERRPGSTFLSWGGTGTGVRPLPSPYLHRLRNRHSGGERIVVVEWILPPDPYLIRFASTPLGNQGYRQSTLLLEFVCSVKAVGSRLFLKRFPSFVAGAERDPAVAALPHQPPVTRRTASRLMAAARLAVISYPDTPFIEAMTIGVPTIGLWDPDLWELREDARAPFEALRDAGIVFSDPHAAAAHVDRVYEVADEWWASAEIQAARQVFLSRFATSGDWVAQWAAFLRELSGVG